MNKTAVILINTGSPATTRVSDVRRYLREFLGDKRVITLPWLGRKLLVNGIIAPFRAPKSAGMYRKVWTSDGSPLLSITRRLQEKLQLALGNDYEVIMGMRYGSPSLHDALLYAKYQHFQQIILVPLFPQYASATSGSAIDLALHAIGGWNVIPAVKLVGQFYNHTGFLDCFSGTIMEMNPSQFDHVLFSFHSLPVSQVRSTHNGKDCQEYNCTSEVNDQNQYCYHATCYATARELTKRCGIPASAYTVCFQSRFARNWIGPFADKVVKQKAKEGIKRLLVVSPAFVTDCLETIEEIGHGYQEIFLENGGEQIGWVKSLNDNDKWVATLKEIITA